MTPQLGRVDDFQAAMVHRTIDCLAFNEVHGPSHDMWRTSADLARGGSPVFFLNLYLSGSARVEQNGLEAAAGPGHLLLFDSSVPFKLRQPAPTGLLSLAVPHAAFTGPQVSPCVGRPLRLPQSAPALLLASQMQALSKWRGDIPVPEAVSIAQALVGLLRAALPAATECGPGPLQQRRARGKVAALIGRHYANPGYTPARAAHEMGISVRTLHAWLARDGTSFGAELWAHRLERARAILQAEPQLAVQEVALRCGFVSAAHLSRRFRERFGVAPRAWRDSH